MLKKVSNQWRDEIIDAVGINEFTDMYIQAIRQYISEDFAEFKIEQECFDEYLNDEIMDAMLSKIMHLVYEKEEELRPLPIETKVMIARAILNDVDFYEINFSKEIDHEALMKQIKQNKSALFQMAKDFEFIEKENIVKATCKELGLTYKELGEAIGYSGDTLNNAARADKVSIPLQKAIELYKKTLVQEKELEKLTTLKNTLKSIIK